ncbi:MAG TPA: hypothetical protein VNN77_12350 [candidate division Zixibacteria bacterium]|nr:hypothetical protein [candidate division Zixibacteria bacterium]
MAKRPLKFKIRLPSYVHPRLAWREAIYRQAKLVGAVYRAEDKLEVIVRLYLEGGALLTHDVDNRLKDILDALQGRIGGSKAIRRFVPIIPNDNQVYRVVIEKLAPPAQSHGLGHLIVRKYAPNKTLERTRMARAAQR